MATHLPHITNIAAGVNNWDPMHQCIFEVAFTLPAAIASEFQDYVKEDGGRSAILTHQVTQVSGLDVLQKTTEAGSQKFMGVDVSFLNPVLDSTFAEITIDLNLNLKDKTNAYVLKVFKAWAKLGYDLADGTRTLMNDYYAENLQISEANRDGTVWRVVNFRKVLLTGVTGLETLNYTENGARTLQVKFRCDYWEESLG